MGLDYAPPPERVEQIDSRVEAVEPAPAVTNSLESVSFEPEINSDGAWSIDFREAARLDEADKALSSEKAVDVPTSKIVPLASIDSTIQEKLTWHAQRLLKDADQGLISADEMQKLNGVIENPNFKSGSDELKLMCLNYIGHPFTSDEKDPYRVVTETLLSDFIQDRSGPEGEMVKTTDEEFKKLYDLMTLPAKSWFGSLEDKNDLTIIAAVTVFAKPEENVSQAKIVRSFLSPEDKAALYRVISVAGTEYSKDLELIMQSKGGRFDVDKHGDTIFKNLGEIAEIGSIKDPEIAKLKPELLASFIKELAHPKQIVSAGTGPEMAIRSFCEYDPAEVTRLVKGLLLDGQVECRKEGEYLSLNTEAVKYLASGGLGMTGAVLMPSMMEYANGQYYNYDIEAGMSVSNGKKLELRNVGGRGTTRTMTRGSDKSYQGLNARGMTKLMESFYDKKCSTKELWNPVRKESTFKALQEQNRSPVTFAGIRTEDGDHTVAVTAIRDGKVYYQNPLGREADMPTKEFTKGLQTVSIQKER